MPKPLPNEIQHAIVNAVESGMPVSQAITHFRGARRTIFYYLQKARLHRDGVRRGTVPGPKSKLTDYRSPILQTLSLQPDISIKELCEQLQLPVTPSTLSRALAMWKRSVSQQIESH